MVQIQLFIVLEDLIAYILFAVLKHTSCVVRNAF